MLFRIANYDLNPNCIVALGAGPGGTVGVYTTSPTMPFIPQTAVQLKAIRTQFVAWQQRTTALSAAPPPGVVKHRATRIQKTAHAGSGAAG